MKKINAKLMLVLLICVLFLVGCSKKVSGYKADSSDDRSMFVLIEKTYAWRVVYHKDTKVMYVVSNGAYNSGTFTLLVDAQGRPMLWEERK